LAELDLAQPARPDLLDRVDLGGGGRLDRRGLGRHVRGHHVLGDRLEEAVLVAEQPVDRRRLDARPLRHAPGGDGRGPAVVEQLGRCLDDRGAGVGAGHGPTVTETCYRR
jgi:hypothetical protein